MKILSGQISAGVPLLFGKHGFYFEPNLGQGHGVSAGNPGQQQQQQQQQQADPQQTLDPFAGMDLDLMDDQTRTRIEAARQSFATIANQNQTLQQQQQALAQQMEAMQQQSQQQQQQQRQQPPPQDPVDEFSESMVQEYVANGIPEDQARKLAKMNSGIFQKFEKGLTTRLGQHLSPVFNQVADQTAQSAYETVMASDTLGAFDIPEVAQAVWDQTTRMSQQGQLVDDQLVRNFARIAWAKHVEEHGMPDTQTQQNPFQRQQQQGIPRVPVLNMNQPQNQQTRFTFPGAGVHVRAPQPVRRNDGLDAETQAAVAATVGNWQIKPQAFRTNGPNGARR